MFRRIAEKVTRAVVGVVKRFATNQPANQYEDIIFGAIRSVAMTFARA